MDRNTLTALLLIAVVLILTPYYLEVVSPAGRRTTDSLLVEGEVAPTLQTPYLEELPTTEPEKSLVLPRPGAVDEKVFSIETDLYLSLIHI